MTLAPVGILAYSRIEHLRKTIRALQNNTLAQQTDLYIFLDGPKKGDEEIVGRVRRYVDTIDGFNMVHIGAPPISGH